MLSSWIQRFRNLPAPLLMAHVFAKFLGGVGLGLLIAGYAGGDWTAAGWWTMAAALVMSLPSTKRILAG